MKNPAYTTLAALLVTTACGVQAISPVAKELTCVQGMSGRGQSDVHPVSLQAKHGRQLAVSPAQRAVLQVRGGSGTPALDVVGFLSIVDIFGTGVFAFSGALTAGKKGMDLLGMIVIATITALGGGTVRDLLLDSGTVSWMRQPIYFELCAVVAVLTYFIWPILENRWGIKDSSRAICVSDALGLGAFAVLGTQTAADHPGELDPIIWVVCGLMSACFGGVTRDVICLQKPRIMYPDRTLYAPPPLIGSICYTLLTARFDADKDKAAFISFLLTFVLRILSFDNPARLPHWKQPGGSDSTASTKHKRG